MMSHVCSQATYCASLTLIWLAYSLAAKPTVLSSRFQGQHNWHCTQCAAFLTRHNMALYTQMSPLQGSLPPPAATANLSTLYLLYDLYGGRATSLSVNTRVRLGTTPSPRPINQSTHTLCWESVTCCDAQPPCQPRNLQLNRRDTDEWDYNKQMLYQSCTAFTRKKT